MENKVRMTTRTLDIPNSASFLAAVCLAGGLLVGAILSFGSWFVLQRLVNDRLDYYQITIPVGTAELVRLGATPPSIPAGVSLADGATVRIVNQDSVAHQLGDFVVPSGETTEFTFNAESSTSQSNQFVCTFHPGSIFELSLDEAPPLASNLIPMFAIGLPIALVGFIAVSVATRLESD